MQDGGLTDEEAIDVNLLWFSFMDILASLRTNSRVILFNTDTAVARLMSRLPAGKLKDAVTFLNMFERFEGPILVPRPRFELSGFDQNFFGSPEFTNYCSAHDFLNSAQEDRVRALDRLRKSVITGSNAYDKFVEESVMAFAVSKAASHAMNAMSGGTFKYIKDFLEVVVRLCKESDRNLTLYSGKNFEQFCAKVAMNAAFGKRADRGGHENQGLWHRIGTKFLGFGRS